MLFHQIGDLVALDVAVELFQISVARQHDVIVLQLVAHFRRPAFYRLAVILHLIESSRVTETFDHLFAFLVARTGDHHFISVNLDRPLGHDHVTGEGDDIALHVQRLLIGLDMDRLIGIARLGEGRQAGGQ